ncbi:MAG TPA: uroporphyrinogen-III C-methyltransferase [Elusimicrobiota bacterium]|nr:uroporphyrinogen-III C-methyltransferase [Elusimicrobiota bacterium]
MAKGKVFLIGAGPGEPGLLTLRGRDCLARADVVVYDALVDPKLLEWTRLHAPKIYVGKRGRRHAKEQREINELLVQQALRGRQVARLKGGDPFLFGRGGEEAAYLYEHDIAFEVVPGVSSASGAAAYAGIPLTDRRLASMVTMVTGHEGQGKQTAPVEWSRISRQSTLVIFMGLDQLPFITERLIKHLWPEDLPAALVRWGSTTHQLTIEGTLADIAEKAEKAQLSSPVLAIFGRVVGLRKKLRWFDTKPLFGKKIVITRAAEQSAEFARLLEETGAEVVPFPAIQIVPPKSWTEVDAAIRDITQFDWLLFTSVNGVRSFFSRLLTLGRDIRELQGIRIGAIGPKTAARLRGYGLKIDAFPDEYRAEALADVVGQAKGCRVLLARALDARDVLPKTLEGRGATVTIAPVYRTVKGRLPIGDLKKRLLNREIDAVTFTSSSTVDGFLRHFNARERRRIFEHAKAAAIGPITAATLKDHGIRAAIRAPRYTTEALAKAIVKYFTK